MNFEKIWGGFFNGSSKWPGSSSVLSFLKRKNKKSLVKATPPVLPPDIMFVIAEELVAAAHDDKDLKEFALASKNQAAAVRSVLNATCNRLENRLLEAKIGESQINALIDRTKPEPAIRALFHAMQALEFLNAIVETPELQQAATKVYNALPENIRDELADMNNLKEKLLTFDHKELWPVFNKTVLEAVAEQSRSRSISNTQTELAIKGLMGILQIKPTPKTKPMLKWATNNLVTAFNSESAWRISHCFTTEKDNPEYDEIRKLVLENLKAAFEASDKIIASIIDLFSIYKNNPHYNEIRQLILKNPQKAFGVRLESNMENIINKVVGTTDKGQRKALIQILNSAEDWNQKA